MKKEPEVGDYITILKRPDMWSSGAGGRDGRNTVEYPYTGKITSKKNYHHFAVVTDGTWGWDLSDKDTHYKLVGQEDYEIY